MAKINNENKGNESIPRSLIFDTKLSDRARFVYCYMSAKPEGWDFVLAPMAKELNYSVDTLRKYIAELVASGWIVKGDQSFDEVTKKFGSVEYTIKSRPSRVGKNPIRQKPHTEKTRDGKNPTQDINSSINTPLNEENIEKKGLSINKPKKARVSLSPEEQEKEDKFVASLKERYPRVMKMDIPLTYKQSQDLAKDFTPDEIRQALEEMDNWKPLLKKRVDACKTLRNWIERNRERA